MEMKAISVSRALGGDGVSVGNWAGVSWWVIRRQLVYRWWDVNGHGCVYPTCPWMRKTSSIVCLGALLAKVPGLWTRTWIFSDIPSPGTHAGFLERGGPGGARGRILVRNQRKMKLWRGTWLRRGLLSPCSLLVRGGRVSKGHLIRTCCYYDAGPW